LVAGFSSFTVKFVKNVTGDSVDLEYAGTTNSEDAKYFEDGPSGYKIFNPAGLNAIEMAKQIWNRSEFKREFMEFLPKFDMMKKYARLHISNGPFLDFLISKVSEHATS